MHAKLWLKDLYYKNQERLEGYITICSVLLRYIEISICTICLKLPETFPKINTFKHDKMRFSIKDFFSKYNQIRRKLRIWSRLLKKSLMENFILCTVIPLSMKKYVFCESSIKYFPLGSSIWALKKLPPGKLSPGTLPLLP